jgi:hypothetical protein
VRVGTWVEISLQALVGDVALAILFWPLGFTLKPIVVTVGVQGQRATGRCAHKADVLTRQMCSQGRCAHKADVLTRQMCSQGRCADWSNLEVHG